MATDDFRAERAFSLAARDLTLAGRPLALASGRPPGCYQLGRVELFAKYISTRIESKIIPIAARTTKSLLA
jgi:hypothetical protein